MPALIRSAATGAFLEASWRDGGPGADGLDRDREAVEERHARQWLDRALVDERVAVGPGILRRHAAVRLVAVPPAVGEAHDAGHHLVRDADLDLHGSDAAAHDGARAVG